MGQIVFWLIVVFAVLLVLRLVNTAQSRARRGSAGPAKPRKQDAMVRCVDCGVYLPSADAKAGPQGPLCGDPQCVRSHARRED